MQITVETPGPSIPTVTFPEINMGVDYAIVDSERRQQTEYGTGEPKTWDDGNPMLETVNTGIVIGGNAKISTGEDASGNKTYRDLEPGETIRVHMKGATEKRWFAAVSAAAGNVNVGDKVRHVFNELGEAKKAGWNRPKFYSVALSADVDPAIRTAAEAEAKTLAAQSATPVEVATPPQQATAAASTGPAWGVDPFSDGNAA